MANTFTSYLNKNIPTTGATVVTASGGTQTTVIGLSCANISTANTITADVYITRSAVDYYLVKGATVPIGGALVVVGGDQKVVIINGDALKVVSSADTTIDVFASVLAIS